VTALHVTPSAFAITGRRIAGRCQAPTPGNRKHRHCKRPIALHISYQLNVAASVTFTIKQLLTGRLSRGKCTAINRANRHARHCMRLIGLPGTLKQPGVAGANDFVFTGRIGGRLLGPGSYQLTASPSSSSGGGATTSVSFHLSP
jgi:hypothetical protein